MMTLRNLFISERAPGRGEREGRVRREKEGEYDEEGWEAEAVVAKVNRSRT